MRTVAQASCRMAHPRRGKLWKLSARPGGKDVHAGCGEQWITALEAGIDIIPNSLKGHFCLEMAQCSMLTLDAFCLLGDEEVSPGRTLRRCNTRFCEDDEPNTAPAQ
jgi:hypothetical protein